MVSHSLSSGAKTGIGVGVAVAGLLIILAIAWAFTATRKLKRLQALGGDGQGYSNAGLGGIAEKDSNEKEVGRTNEKDSRSESGTYWSSNLPELETHGRGNMVELGP
jgi:hypothetical protein